MTKTVDLKIQGGKSLSGSIEMKTSKNAAVGLLCAALINRGTTTLRKMPRIEEVNRIIEVLQSIGVKISWHGNDLAIQPPSKLNIEKIDAAAATKTRAAFMLIGPLVHYFKKFKLPQAGGCKLGERSIRPHQFALEELGVWYRSLDLMDLPGINVAMARQLHHRKIKTPFDFYLQPLFNLSRWFGHPGRVWFYRLRGFETDEIEPATKSIGHQHVLAPEYRTIAAARRVLVKLAEKCAQRLRAKNLWTGGVSLGIKFLNGPFWEKNAATDLVADSQNIQRIALSLYDACPIQKPPLRIAVTLFNLTQVRGEQISLFSKIEKSRRLSQMMDEINDKYGPETIYPASMFGASEAAPTRIPFGNPARIGNFDQNVV